MARTKPTASPWAANVEVTMRGDESDPSHAEVTVGATWCSAEGYPRHDDEPRRAHLWLAGAIARTVLSLADEVADTRRRHGCRERDDGVPASCHMASWPTSLVAPTADEPPVAWLAVPVGEADAWARKVTKRLNRVLAGSEPRREPREPSAAGRAADDGSDVVRLDSRRKGGGAA